MGIHVALSHTTTYTYDRPVTLLPHVVRLRPAPHARTPIVAYSLKVEPAEQFLNWQQDAYSNYNARLVFPKPARELKVTVDLVADLSPINPFDFFIDAAAEQYPFRYDPVSVKELAPYLEAAPAGPHLAALVAEARGVNVKTLDYVVELNQRVQHAVGYVIRREPGVQTPEETLGLGTGSCRDSAWLLVQLARHLGIAARFCSGYLIQLVADEKPLDGPEGPTADFTDLHAWAELYLPGAGWVGLDPTSGLLAAEGHIPLACTADPQTAAAVSGAFTWDATDEDDKVVEGFDFQMDIRRVKEAPRVTKPYSPEQWAAVEHLGDAIDAHLGEWDVRLTMGGEPTFVSLDDRDADEWNIAALGPNKRRLGSTLVKRLRDRFATGALLHFGQGKWYPGEQLPRWAFNCYWRKDGEPVWADPTLVADEETKYGFGSTQAERFTTALAARLGVAPEFAIPGYEDAWYYMWKERRLPANVDPLKSKLADPTERDRLAKVFDQGLNTVVGYTLPLRRSYAGAEPAWESGPWFLRDEHLYLIPGDSPMGLRLPLDSLPWEKPDARHAVVEHDPFAARGPLPTYHAMQHRPPSGGRKPLESSPYSTNGVALNGSHVASAGSTLGTALGSALGRLKPPARGGEPSGPVVRTAICVEPRGGVLRVFVPPARFLEDYLDLVAAVEATAAALDMPVQIEGYKPPHDPRLNNLSVTPDPGVIEVNVHPANSWRELTDITRGVYEEARLTRLTAEKFMVDGRHTGTGGGNHVVLGGPSAADSPLLRRPDLLRSMIGFWNNHPSLSYLFSGLFIGPTSQHPRVDEARHDSLYDLNLAFKQVDPSNPRPPAWLVDRVFRHLLVDVTGNTHRAEFCIDKLFNPDAAEGRRGLLELRSFEMPPHERMSGVQQLLLRGLVAWFWQKPYNRELAKWGTELHDRFMLPHFVEQDFHDALDEIRRGGFTFDPDWFAPHVEFRYPVLGEVTSRGVNLELRIALEPWPVLGEEGAPGGVARYVDSSVERVQVKVRGLTDTRHVVTCNGRRVPLHPTGTNGEFVAGVRYRAWQPPSCLHPTVGVHAPLVFDILDSWNDRSLGGCTYHVAHPGGKSSETLPVNAREAEGRRLGRFVAFNHTPGPVRVPPPEPTAEFPLTLDLRQPEPVRYAPPPTSAARFRPGLVTTGLDFLS